MNRFKIIFRALWKRKFINILIIFQIVVSLMLLFKIVETLNNFNYIERKIQKFMDLNAANQITFNMKFDTGAQIKNIVKFEEEVKNMDGVKSFGTYDYTNVIFEEFRQDNAYHEVRKRITKGTFKEEHPEVSEIIKTDYDIYKLMNLKVLEGEELKKEDFDIEGKEKPIPILIGYEYKDVVDIGKIIYDADYDRKYIVKGVAKKNSEWINELNFETRDVVNLDKQFIIPFSKEEKSNVLLSGTRLGSMFVILEDPNDSREVKNRIKQKFKNIVDQKVEIKSAREKIDDFKNEGKFEENFGILISIFLLISSSMGIVIVTISSIKTRKREIGIRITVGASKRYIRSLIMGEIFILNLISIIICILLNIKSLNSIDSVVFVISTSFLIMFFMTVLLSIIPITYLNRLQPKELIGGVE